MRAVFLLLCLVLVGTKSHIFRNQGHSLLNNVRNHFLKNQAYPQTGYGRDQMFQPSFYPMQNTFMQPTPYVPYENQLNRFRESIDSNEIQERPQEYQEENRQQYKESPTFFKVIYGQHTQQPQQRRNKWQSYKQNDKSKTDSNSNENSHESKERKQENANIYESDYKASQQRLSEMFDKSQRDLAKIYSDAYSTMKKTDDDSKIKFHEAYEAASQIDNEDYQMNATQLLMKNHYEVEEHRVKTEDGYILTIFRIPPKQILHEEQKRPVVFLMHGLLGSADDWLIMGPKKSLGYLLADAGYDVWMGNIRGNKYSRQHIWKHSALTDFWEFSNDEISLIDLPTMIDYVLQNTNQEKLFYVGHSQGTTSFFALASVLPEYNEKVTMMYALSPMAYLTNVRSPALRLLAPTTSPFAEIISNELGNKEFNSSGSMSILGGDKCEEEIGCKNICSNAIFLISGVNMENMDPTQLPIIMNHLPAGTSSKVLKHYAQGVDSNEFRRYDYGPGINKDVYGQLEPPKYELKNITAPVSLFWSEMDWLATPTDVKRLEKELPSMQESYKVPDQSFSNLDFIISKNAPEMVYGRVLQSIQKYLPSL